MLKPQAIALALALLFVGGLSLLASTSKGYLDVSDLREVNEPRRVAVDSLIVGFRVEGGDLVILLQGRDGSLVEVLMPYDMFLVVHARPPGNWMIGTEITVKGVFYPGGAGQALGYLEVEEILNPCHEAYSSPAANV